MRIEQPFELSPRINRMLDLIRAWCGYRIPPMGHQVYVLFRKFGPKTLDTHLFANIQAKLDLTDTLQFDTWWQGRRFEKPTCLIFEEWLPQASHFFDIGANYGFFTWLALDKSSTIKVNSFEPHPRTFALLSSIRERNNLSSRLSGWNIGLGDSRDVLPLHPGHSDLGRSTFLNDPQFPVNLALQVEILPFDTWLEASGPPLPSSPQWVAKIDVEGFEIKVLRGMEKALKARAFLGLIVEINEVTLELSKNRKEQIYDFLRGFGYEALTTQDEPRLKGYIEHSVANAFFVPK
jgi:FkbM family methyltransferase